MQTTLDNATITLGFIGAQNCGDIRQYLIAYMIARSSSSTRTKIKEALYVLEESHLTAVLLPIRFKIACPMKGEKHKRTRRSITSI